MNHAVLDSESPGSTRRARQWLLEGILSGERAPNSPLRFDALRAESGFGMSALREALIQLEVEKFATFDLGRGFRTARLSLAELKDINRSRIFAESQALRESIAAGTMAWEGHIVSTLHQLLRQPEHGAKAPGTPHAQEWERHHRAFHHALIAACPSKWVLRFCESLSPHYQRYRHYIWRQAKEDAAEIFGSKVDDEHQALARLVIDRRADDAVEALRAHYQTNMDMLIRICDDHPHIIEA